VVRPERYDHAPWYKWRAVVKAEATRLAGWPLSSVAAMTPDFEFERFAKGAAAEAQP